ncbi:MAG: hypothetical protein U0176_18675 [Bacteroidia bacterium]
MEFIELYNNTDTVIDLMAIMVGVICNNAIVSPLIQDSAAISIENGGFNTFFPTLPAIANFGGSLANTGESLVR